VPQPVWQQPAQAWPTQPPEANPQPYITPTQPGGGYQSWPNAMPQPAQPPPPQGRQLSWPPVAPNWPPTQWAPQPGPLPQAAPLGALHTMALDELGSVEAQIKKRRRRRRYLAAMILCFAMVAGSAAAFFMLVPLGEETGKVTIISVPEGASVVFDGKPIEKPTPVEIAVPDTKATHSVEVALANYRPYKSPIAFEGQTSLRVLAVLTPIFGTLEITSSPPDADVYLEGTHHGRTPLTIQNLSPTADVNIELRRLKCDPVRQVVKWDGRTHVPVNIRMRCRTR
jgi:hypothetical protein